MSAAASGRWRGFAARRPLLLVAAAALCVDLLFLLLLPGGWRIDESADFDDFYLPVAQSLLAGEGLVDRYGQPAVRYPPGYPFLVAAACGAADLSGSEASLWLLGASVACFVATAVLLFQLASRTSRSPAVAWLAALAWITYPPLLWLGKQPNSEMPFLVLFLAALVGWSRCLAPRAGPGVALEAGLLLGLAALIRPAGLAVAVPLALVTLLVHWLPGGRRLRTALLIVLGQLLVMAPWELFMHHHTGRWLPLSSGGRLSMLDGLTIAVKPGREGPPVGADVKALMQEIDDHRRQLRTPIDVARFLAPRDKKTLLKLLAIKAARSWYATDSLRYEQLLLWMQALYLSLALAGAVVGWRQGGARRLLVVCAGLITAYFWGMTILVLSILRYMVPAMALQLILAALAVHTGCERWRRRPSQPPKSIVSMAAASPTISRSTTTRSPSVATS